MAQTGGTIAGNTRKEIEKKIGKSVLSNQRAVQLNHVVTGIIEGTEEIVSVRKTDIDNQDA